MARNAGPPSHGFEVIDYERAALGESPVYDPQTRSVWWVDVTGQRLYRTCLGRRQTQAWPMPEETGFVVLAASERPVIGMESGLFGFEPETGMLSRLLALSGSGIRFNDATIDGFGRLWVSTMHVDVRQGCGALHRVTADLSLAMLRDGLTTPNGLAFDRPRSRLYYSDSHPTVKTIWTASFDEAGSRLGEPQIMARYDAPDGGRPDGAALDDDGRYWIAATDAGAIDVYSAAGARECRLPVPIRSPTKLAFVGEDLSMLAVTSKTGVPGDGGRLLVGPAPTGTIGALQPFWKIGGC